MITDGHIISGDERCNRYASNRNDDTRTQTMINVMVWYDVCTIHCEMTQVVIELTEVLTIAQGG
jgi:hypothetical protein